MQGLVTSSFTCGIPTKACSCAAHLRDPHFFHSHVLQPCIARAVTELSTTSKIQGNSCCWPCAGSPKKRSDNATAFFHLPISAAVPLLQQATYECSDRLRHATRVQRKAHTVQVGITSLFTGKVATVYGCGDVLTETPLREVFCHPHQLFGLFQPLELFIIRIRRVWVVVESVKEDAPHCGAFFVLFALMALASAKVVGPFLPVMASIPASATSSSLRSHCSKTVCVDTYHTCQTADMCTNRQYLAACAARLSHCTGGWQ